MATRADGGGASRPRKGGLVGDSVRTGAKPKAVGVPGKITRTAVPKTVRKKVSMERTATPPTPQKTAAQKAAATQAKRAR